MFIAALLTIAKMWEQPKCPATDERINQMGSNHTMEYYSAIRRSGVLSHATMNLREVQEVRNKRSHIGWFHLYEIPWSGKSTETEGRAVVVGGLKE